MDKKLVLEFLFSQKFFVILLILIPFVLYFSFGNVLYNEDHLGRSYLDEKTLPMGGGEYFKDERYKIYDEKIDVNGINDNLELGERTRYYNSFYSSTIIIAKICIIIGGIAAAVTGSDWVSNGHIIYILVNQKSKWRSFLGFVFWPIPFLLLISFVSAAGITNLSSQSFPFKPSPELLLLPFFMIFFGLMEGYVLGLGAGVVFKNNILSILVPLGFVFSIPIFDPSQNTLLPYKPFIWKLFANFSITNHNWILGFLMLISIFVIIYIAFERGDFY